MYIKDLIMRFGIKILLLFSSFFWTVCLTAQNQADHRLAQLEQMQKAQEKDLEKLKKLKISGYIQAQYQHGQKDAVLNIGNENNDFESSYSRIGIRRGRIKFSYEEKIANAVFQLDLTEKGIAFKDVYINIKEPWLNTNALQVGIFDRPFGYEISYSSSRRESPERSRVFRTLFPDERDLGAMLVLQAGENSFWNFFDFKLQGGLFSGNGIKAETDKYKDFIGRFSLSTYLGMHTNIGLGVSYYNGKVYQGTENVYRMEDKSFVPSNDISNKGKSAKREYIGFDVQTDLMSRLGHTRINFEYLFGQQPGTKFSSNSPNGNLPDYDTYIRDFRGGYLMFVQDIGTDFSIVFKYDRYDPNKKTEKNEVGLHGTGQADAMKKCFGFGGIWKATDNIRLQAYYEINKFEKSENLADLNKAEADVFTLRLQYKF